MLLFEIINVSESKPVQVETSQDNDSLSDKVI